MDQLVNWGAKFAWFFHYMPVGNNAVAELLPSPEQREEMYHRIRNYRKTKPIFTIDFQNDGEYVGGCIAGGRNYLHINPNGDIEPCVFIHYSDSNIREKTLLEALTSPLFMAYHDGQPFNENHLRPCPMLENPEKLMEMVQRTGAHSTDLESMLKTGLQLPTSSGSRAIHAQAVQAAARIPRQISFASPNSFTDKTTPRSLCQNGTGFVGFCVTEKAFLHPPKNGRNSTKPTGLHSLRG